MPLTRHRIGNAYGLADPELYRAADKDDPEALLEGVAMAGLVGILRQLGDLAEFAAEMFHDLHEEVMVTAARGHGLMVRVQQLEMEFPSFEKAFLTQTDHSSFFSIPGMDWHPNLHMQQNLVTRGDLPRCVMDSYEECRGPPRLFLLDKFDVAGAGACLKRYSDPSFARVETVSSEAPFVEVQREKRPRKVKKKGLRGKNGGTPDIAPTSHAKLHQLFLEERVGSGLTNSARLVNLKSRKLNGFLFDTKSRRSYMEKLLQTPSPEHKPSSTISSDPLLLTWNTDDSRDSGTDIPEIAVTCAMGKSCQGAETEASSPDENELEPKTREDGYSEAIERDIETVPELIADEELPTPHKMISENSLEMDRKERSEDTFDENHSEDLASEVDNYMDALATIESETDNDDRPRKEPGILNDREQDADYQSIGNVSASNSTSGKGRSSFSYSDIGSISTVSDSFDGGKSAESLLPSISTFEAEVAGVSINNTSVNKDVQRSATYEHELVGRRDVDLEEASCSSNCRSSSHVRPGSEELDTDVNGMSLTDSLTSRVHPPGTLDGDDLGFTSKAIPNLVEIPQMALEEKGESTTIAAFSSTTYDDDNHSGDLANPDICFMTSVISSKEDQFSHSARPETEVYTDSAVSKLGELIPPAESHSESTARSIAETDNIPLSSGISMIDTEIRAPECTRDVPAVGTKASEPVAKPQEIILESASSKDTKVNESTMASEIRAPECTREVPAVGTKASEPMANSPEIIFESRSSKDTEVDGSTTASETDAELKESMSDTSPVSSLEERQVQDAYLKYDNNYPEDEGLSNLVEVNVAIENVVAEEVAISNTDTSKVGEDIDEFFHLSSNSVCSPSTEPINILESNSGGELCRDGLESDKACYVGCDLKSGEKEETCILEVASQHLEPQPDISSCLEVSNDVQDSLDEPSSNHLRAGNDPINPVSADPKELETETNFPLQSSILERTVGALSLGYLDHDHHLDKSIKMNHLQATEAISCQTLRDISENPRCLDNKDLENYVKVSSGSLLETNPDQGLTSELSSQSAVQEIHTLKQTSGLKFSLQSFGLPPEATQTNMDGMPPLPPLPPMQWRIGKAQHTSVLQNEPILAVSSFIAAGDGQNSFSSSTPVSSQFSALVADTSSQHDIVALEGAQPVYPLLTSAVASITPLPEPSEHASLKLDVSSQIPVQELNQAEPENGILDEVSERFSHHSGECHHSIGTSSLTLPPSTVVENQHQCDPPTSESLTTQPSNPSKRKIASNSVEDAMWPVNAFALAAPTFDAGKAIEIPPVKVPRPRSPLVDAVAAHDRSKLKKVSELVRPSTELDVKETDSLLAQIRNKSVNLKPTVVTRPSIQVGTRTNLKVAAILEKANTIRQAMAGSDEDDDSDSWSDS